MLKFKDFCEEVKKMKGADPCWKGYEMIGKKKKNGKEVPNCVPVKESEEPNAEPISKNKNKSSSRFWGTKSLVNIYKKDTPGQNEEHEPGLLKSHRSVEQIAKKHKVDVQSINDQLKMGIKIEREHTKDADTAKDIALQHLWEKPNYYTKLKKVEEEVLTERGADSKGYYRSTESGAGLTPKGAKHFGIKTAVTTEPSKLKRGGKAWKRRKSFCARMSGMKGPMKDEKGRPTRKAMSLRRWNC